MRKRREKSVQDSSRGNFWAKKDEDIKAEIVVTRPEEARKRCSRPGVDTRLCGFRVKLLCTRSESGGHQGLGDLVTRIPAGKEPLGD
jgi:hypothetical protein